jgi:hypothetical protein
VKELYRKGMDRDGPFLDFRDSVREVFEIRISYTVAGRVGTWKMEKSYLEYVPIPFVPFIRLYRAVPLVRYRPALAPRCVPLAGEEIPT